MHGWSTPAPGLHGAPSRRPRLGTTLRERRARSAASGLGETRTRLSVPPGVNPSQNLGHHLREVKAVSRHHDRVVGRPHRSDRPAGVTAISLLDLDPELLWIRA